MPASPNKWLWIGAAGAALTALCCFTPILVIALAGLGAASLAVYLDAVLLPLLGFFLVLVALGLWQLRRRATHDGQPT